MGYKDKDKQKEAREVKAERHHAEGVLKQQVSGVSEIGDRHPEREEGRKDRRHKVEDQFGSPVVAGNGRGESWRER